MRAKESLNHNVRAWLFLMGGLAVHVLDETLTDFLPFYNQTVLDLRERLGFFLIPTFSFAIWLGGLIFLITLGFICTPLIRRGGRAIRIFATVFSFLMILNGSNHIFWSVYFGRLMPGFWSSPPLIAASLYLFVRTRDKSLWLKTGQIQLDTTGRRSDPPTPG